MFLLAGSVLLLIQGWIHPDYPHDALTYQLFMPAAWLRAGKICLIQTPFGDPSQAYAPGNAQVFYLWLMGIPRSDVLAVVGQWPFLILSLLAAVGISQRLGVSPPWDLWPGIFLLCAPVTIMEATSALSDLMLSALFLSSILLFLVAQRTGRPKDLILGFMACGLMAGTKYTSLPWACLLLPLIWPAFRAVQHKSRRPFVALLCPCLLSLFSAAYWYGRNLFLAGNPVYPFEVKWGRLLLFPGAYGREQMLHWVFHRAGWKAWGEVTIEALSPLLWALSLAALLAGTVRWRIWSRMDWSRIYVILLPFLMDRIQWHILPYQESRFWTPMVGLGGVAIVCLTPQEKKWRFPLLAWCGLALCLNPFLSSQSSPQQIALLWALGISGSILLSSQILTRLGRSPLGRQVHGVVLVVGMLLPVAGLMVFGIRWDHARARTLMKWSAWPGWTRWLEAGRKETIAYAGSNLPFPLCGPDFHNRVLYVNLDGHPSWQFHDYDLRRQRQDSFVSFHTPEPAPYRLTWQIDAWWTQFLCQQVDFLFVTKLGPSQTLNIVHTQGWWPIEEVWASSHPELFERYWPVDPEGWEFVRVYRVKRDSSPTWKPGECAPVTRPSDAVEAYFQDRAWAESFFPCARDEPAWEKTMEGR